VWAWGDNSEGQLGRASSGSVDVEQVPGLTNVIAIAGGERFSMTLGADGTVWPWGANASGQLGRGMFLPSSSADPEQVPGLTGVTAIAAGGLHSMALLSDGTVRTWGDNFYGQLGRGSFTISSPFGSADPQQVPGLGGIVSVAAGLWHSLAVGSDGTLRSWGDNEFGQLGNGTFTALPPNGIAAPGIVPGVIGVIAAVGGGSHTLILTLPPPTNLVATP
jgi:hypothetical protein